MQVYFFGQLTDITRDAQVEIAAVADTESLLALLKHQFPALAAAKFVIAVDKTIVRENTALSNHSQVALLPPFSGG